jgi:5-oxoprolinase (ATP-hydrolysing) subunit A
VTPVRSIDLNADVGEGFDDAALMPLLSSANVAAGGHAGDDASIARTVALAKAHGVAIGAHPSYPDRANFGRGAMELSPEVLEVSLVEQIDRVLRAAGSLRHVKPHGALYHRASQDSDVAHALLAAIRRVDARVVLVGQAGSRILDLAQAQGLSTWGEAFADRGYSPDGALLPRGTAGALVTDPSAAAKQALELAGWPDVQTLCVHSDTPGAVAVAEAVRKQLLAAGYTLSATR